MQPQTTGMGPSDTRWLAEQHLQHMRHIETEIHWVMTGFAAVTTGVLAFLAERLADPASTTQPVGYLLVIFACFAFLLTIRWISAFEHHRARANLLIRQSLPEDWPGATDGTLLGFSIPDIEMPILATILRTRIIFPLFYCVVLVACARLFPGGPGRAALATAVLAFLVLLYFCVRGLPSIEGKYHRRAGVALVGCNGYWSQKSYLPYLSARAASKTFAHELWCVDVPDDKDFQDANWDKAKKLGKAAYIAKDRLYRRPLRDADFVFIVAPDLYHCDIAAYWLTRLSARGKIFIEKPLDAFPARASQFRGEVSNRRMKDQVFVFDHYLAKSRPFLERIHEALARIGNIEGIKFFINEESRIPARAAGTLDRGVIYDLFCHVLAVVGATVDRNHTVSASTLKAIRLLSVWRSRYDGCPISGETSAQIGFTLNGIRVDCELSKGHRHHDDKRMLVRGADGGQMQLDFVANRFHVLSTSGINEGPVELLATPVQTFLEDALAGNDPMGIPGVLGLAEALEILNVLEAARTFPGNSAE